MWLEISRDEKKILLKSRAVLLVGQPCVSCEEAEQLWREVAAVLDVRIEVRHIDLDTPATGKDAEKITALPVLMVDGIPLVVGVPEADAATALLRQALARS